jgi:hypothetical protein
MPKNMFGGNKAKKQSNKKVQQRKDENERAEREVYIPLESDTTLKFAQVEKIHNIREFDVIDLATGTKYWAKIFQKSNNRLVGKIKIGSILIAQTLDCMKGKLDIVHLYSDTQKIELERLGKIPSADNKEADKIKDIFGPQVPIPEVIEENTDFDLDDIEFM